MVVFRDIRPATDHHYLVAVKQHIPDAKQLKNEHIELGNCYLSGLVHLLAHLRAEGSQG